MSLLTASQRREHHNPLPQILSESLRMIFAVLNPVHCLSFETSFLHQKTHASWSLFHHPFPTALSIPSTSKMLNRTAFYFSCFALIHDKTCQFVCTSELPLNSMNIWDSLGNEECLWACMGKNEQPGSSWTAEKDPFLRMAWTAG